MNAPSAFRKWLPGTAGDTAVVLFGLMTLILGLVQIPIYFGGIHPPQDSGALAVVANPYLGIVQIVLAGMTLTFIVFVTKLKRGWLKLMVIVAMAIILLLESAMGIGYSGV